MVGCSDNTSSDTTIATSKADTTAVTTPDTTLVNPDPVKVEVTTHAMTIEQSTLVAGTINFEVTNPERVPHNFIIARGESWEALPKNAEGEVDAEALGDDFIVKTGAMLPGIGNVKEVTVDLTPGTYVLYCDGDGDAKQGSHAGLGETVVITVVE